MNKFKIFSFFSGSGFLDLGFELAGYSIDLVNELSPAFIKAYKYSREVMNLEKPRFGYSNIDINGNHQHWNCVPYIGRDCHYDFF